MSVEYSKIVPSAETKGQGAFVRTLVGGTGTGFADDSHVHKDWYQKTQSYDDVMEQIQADIDNREDIMVIVGGVIPAQDYQFLFDAGAVGIYGPGTKIAQAAIELLEILIESTEE